MPTQPSAFLLLFRNASPETYKALSPEQNQQVLERWNSWYDDLASAGKLQYGHPLEPEGRVLVGRGGRIVDGPFAESKEAIGGYFFLTVNDLDEATEIARRCPGLQHGITVEVRPIAEYCHLGPIGAAQREAKGLAKAAS